MIEFYEILELSSSFSIENVSPKYWLFWYVTIINISLSWQPVYQTKIECHE